MPPSTVEREHGAHEGAESLASVRDSSPDKDRTRSAEELAVELEQAKLSFTRTRASLEAYKRNLGLLSRLVAAESTCSDLASLASTLLAIFVEAGRADAGTLLVREGSRLRARAGFAAGSALVATFEEPLASATHTRAVELGSYSAPPDGLGPRWDFLRVQGTTAMVAVPLRAGDDLVGIVDLGSVEPRELSAEARQFLALLGAHGGAAFRRRTTLQTLEDAVRMRDRVIAVVAHDLRNPLNVISMNATSLLQRMPDAFTRRPVERIARGAQRAERLIEDLLDIDAIEGGRFSIQKRTVETSQLILSALEGQQSLAANASIVTSLDISPELPLLQADEERVHEVLENLIGNAMKFTGPGGSITLGASPRGNEVLLWVKDTGPGIPAEELPHVFDRFWQAQKKDRRGTGLGLTICKAIVEAHGGKIWMESELGAGTTAYFTLPAAPARSAEAEAKSIAKILLVDDRQENLTALKAILDRPDYQLVTATSGEEALRLALRDHFAVALVDVAMPGMDGLEVARHMKTLERCRDVPILFVTAFGHDPDEVHRAYAAGGADYLVKPLDADIVRKKVAVFVNLSRRRQHEPLSGLQQPP